MGKYFETASRLSLRSQSSIIFASMAVQVARDAMASPTITIFTGRTALRNIPQGERSCEVASASVRRPQAARRVLGRRRHRRPNIRERLGIYNQKDTMSEAFSFRGLRGKKVNSSFRQQRDAKTA
jgi:hypothetical protein